MIDKICLYAVVKYTILCTGETKLCKLTKLLPIQAGLLDFHDSGGGFDKGRGNESKGVKARGGGVRASKNRKNYYSLNQFIF